MTDVTGLAQLALMLETIAAQTYQAETSMLKSTAAIGLSASIQPVEMQHIAILYYVMGMYPGSQTTAGHAASPSAPTARRPKQMRMRLKCGSGRPGRWRAPCSWPRAAAGQPTMSGSLRRHRVRPAATSITISNFMFMPMSLTCPPERRSR